MEYKIIDILDQILGPHQRFAKGEYYYHCQFCHHHNKKLAVNVVRKKWHCWKCNARGNTLLSLVRRLDVSRDLISQLQEHLKEEVSRYKVDDQSESELKLPDEYKFLLDVTSMDRTKAMEYLAHRGIGELEILRYRIGVCSEGMYRGRVIVPSYSNSKLNYFVGRSFIGGQSWAYKTPAISKNLIGFEDDIEWDEPIVLCEGVFDAIAIKRNAIPLFGKYVPPKLRKKIVEMNVKDIYLALDQDALTDTIRHAERFLREGRRVHCVQLAGKDPSDIGFVKMQELIREATPLNFHSLLQLKLSFAMT